MTIAKLVKEEMFRRHERHAAHCDGICFTSSDDEAAALLAVAEALLVERDALRAIIEGRTTPPTDAEARAHFAAGGSFADCGYLTRGRAFSLFDLAFAKAAVATSGRPARWWALDASDRPCAWPEVTR